MATALSNWTIDPVQLERRVLLGLLRLPTPAAGPAGDRSEPGRRAQSATARRGIIMVKITGVQGFDANSRQ